MRRSLPPLTFLLLLTAAAAAHLLLYRGWLVDDAWITWRYSEHLAGGLGAVYNPGERVEGFSNPAWVALGAAALRLGIAPATAAFWVSALAVLAALPLGFALVRRCRPDARWAPLLPALVLAASPTWVRHAGNGLETAAFGTAVLALAALAGGRGGGPARSVGLTASALAVLWLRPEGFVYVAGAALIHVAGLRKAEGGRPRAGLAVWGVVATAAAASLLIRWSFYGAWVPNTYHAKMTGTVAGWVDGVQYLADFLREGTSLLLPALAAVPLVLGSLGRTGWTLLGAAGLAAAVAVGAGGDWMLHFRFLAPALPPLAVVAGLGLADLGTWAARTGRRAVTAAVLAVLAAAALAGIWNVELALWRQVAPARAEGTERVMVYAEVGRWLAARTGPEALIAASDIGAVGAMSERRILDMFGLVDAHVARRPGKQHHKTDPDYVLEQDPEAVVLIRDAASPGRYGRLPDAALASRARFHGAYDLIEEFPLPADGEVVEVYLRRPRAAPGER